MDALRQGRQQGHGGAVRRLTRLHVPVGGAHAARDRSFSEPIPRDRGPGDRRRRRDHRQVRRRRSDGSLRPVRRYPRGVPANAIRAGHRPARGGSRTGAASGEGSACHPCGSASGCTTAPCSSEPWGRTGLEFTVLGDTVNVASRLERPDEGRSGTTSSPLRKRSLRQASIRASRGDRSRCSRCGVTVNPPEVFAAHTSFVDADSSTTGSRRMSGGARSRRRTRHFQ